MRAGALCVRGTSWHSRRRVPTELLVRQAVHDVPRMARGGPCADPDGGPALAPTRSRSPPPRCRSFVERARSRLAAVTIRARDALVQVYANARSIRFAARKPRRCSTPSAWPEAWGFRGPRGSTSRVGRLVQCAALAESTRLSAFDAHRCSSTTAHTAGAALNAPSLRRTRGGSAPAADRHLPRSDHGRLRDHAVRRDAAR